MPHKGVLFIGERGETDGPSISARITSRRLVGKLIVREDGRIERTCVHGIGHPVGTIYTWEAWMGVHGCDGCCTKWASEEAPAKG